VRRTVLLPAGVNVCLLLLLTLLPCTTLCREYDKNLHLLLNNCMHYTNGLTSALLADTNDRL
jgi:hypothetical protein